MTVPECLIWPMVYNLALRLYCELEQPKSIVLDTRGRLVRFNGILPLSHEGIRTRATAACRFVIGPDWLEQLPYVACDEPWVIRGDADWHTYTNGSLCFEFEERWRDELAIVAAADGLGPAAEFARIWCLNSTRCLLWKHLAASRARMKEWPREWDSWSHGPAAHQQYLREKLRQVAHSPCT